jgi:hypothetical protein
MTPNFIKPKIIKLENITAAPVVRTDMVLTTSPILKNVNILLIQEGLDYIIKKLLFVCGNYLKFGLHQRSSMGHFESITDKNKYFHIHPKRKWKRVPKGHLLEEKDDSNVPFSPTKG